MTKRFILLGILQVIFIPILFAQSIQIDRLEPENWWAGFENPNLQLLVYGPDISDARVTIDYPGVRLLNSVVAENPNYLFLNLVLSEDVEPGNVPIVFRKGDEELTHSYPLYARSAIPNRAQGFDASDVIYLLMPDRFANGDPSNDNIPGMLEQTDRNEEFGRHGGDLKGVRDNLAYMQDLGMTAVWLNPIFENDMAPNYAIGAGFYHGYAATDMYRVDRRFGSNQEFVDLVSEAQRMGMKVIMDMIHNHVGTEHWFIKDMPFSDWVHDQSEYGNTNYRTSAIMDPYASDRDLNSMVKGWFVDEMPDLDQRNEFLATYLIQNTLWWIEYSGIDGIRMDTHPYPYKEYMAEWTRRVLEEFPDFNIVGEAWMPNVATTAYWQYDFIGGQGYNSFLPSVTDFPLFYAMTQAFNEDFGWDTGIMRLYYILSQDFLYTDPMLNVIFFDNHDLTRYFTSVGEDVSKFQMGLAFLLTTRGIPQIYYGTEILMAGGSNDPDKRRDFPGGWQEDPINAFTREGRVELGTALDLPVQQNFEYLRRLVRWRNETPVIHHGELTHFVPENNVYVYFRHDEENTVMVMINANREAQTLDMTRFEEQLHGFTSAREITSERDFPRIDQITVPGRKAMIFELIR
ncbi:MAG: glycosidase [Bacteroidetes bacterium HLUCCA01]|nr:MAG: glycosidase [Bacteroidetes bacterium HLUCCA01]